MPPKQKKQDAPTVALQSGIQRGFAALFSQQRSVAFLAGSEFDVATVNSYDSMSLAQLQAVCGRKHGNSITADKKDNEGQWTKSRKKN